jgi:hypothetical protein
MDRPPRRSRSWTCLGAHHAFLAVQCLIELKFCEIRTTLCLSTQYAVRNVLTTAFFVDHILRPLQTFSLQAVWQLSRENSLTNWRSHASVRIHFHIVMLRMHCPQAVEVLLSLGADTEAKSSKGRTALIHAAWAGQTKTVAQLLEGGCDPHASDNWKKNAADYAGSKIKVCPPFCSIVKTVKHYETTTRTR